MLAVQRSFARSFARGIVPRCGLHTASVFYNQGASQPKLAVQQNPAKIYDFSEIKKLLESGATDSVLIDVREPAELQQQGFIPTAINIPFKSAPGALNLPEDEFEDVFRFGKPAKDKEVIFYCHSGVRSSAAEELAGTFGYEKRGNYVGSFSDWVAQGGKIEKK
ncbi:thiosulfate sulfurtransferase [Saccharomycopsis crataegensis]|uniref:Thiosulfate sulfurtransferase n=1 Tax=Saccharomycopsis crataegensis TaxID=43959 RepID=A0AAV5QG57_9ASCO|nr:thiosulfate sulfurtransferase [Saccharomycopsis crataegensis]